MFGESDETRSAKCAKILCKNNELRNLWNESAADSTFNLIK